MNRYIRTVHEPRHCNIPHGILPVQYTYQFTGGLPGPQGPTGATGGGSGSGSGSGSTGSTGQAGLAGQTGNTGQTGYTGGLGSTGSTGQYGLAGETGYTGQTGYTGMPGSNSGTGSTGTTGDSGATGFTGAMGATGTVGPYTGFAKAYIYDTTTTAGDPGSGKLRISRAWNDQTAGTVSIYVDVNDADGRESSGWFNSMLTYGSSGYYGTINLQARTDASRRWLGQVTNVVNSTGYYTLTVTYSDYDNVAYNGEQIIMTFAGAGRLGATGPSNGPAGSTGSTGPMNGPTGATGQTGPTGSSGYSSSSYLSLLVSGSLGNTGSIGNTGGIISSSPTAGVYTNVFSSGYLTTLARSGTTISASGVVTVSITGLFMITGVINLISSTNGTGDDYTLRIIDKNNNVQWLYYGQISHTSYALNNSSSYPSPFNLALPFSAGDTFTIQIASRLGTTATFQVMPGSSLVVYNITA